MIQLYLIPLVIIIFCIILSVRRGLFLEIISFWNLFISFVLTFTFFETMAESLENFSGSFYKMDDMIIKPISFVVVFISIFMLSSFLTNRIFGRVKIKFLLIIDKVGGALLGITRGFIISSLVLIIVVMFPATESIWQKKENLDIARNIYLIAPKIYEYLVDTLSSESYFDSQIFLNTYGGFLKEEICS